MVEWRITGRKSGELTSEPTSRVIEGTRGTQSLETTKPAPNDTPSPTRPHPLVLGAKCGGVNNNRLHRHRSSTLQSLFLALWGTHKGRGIPCHFEKATEWDHHLMELYMILQVAKTISRKKLSKSAHTSWVQMSLQWTKNYDSCATGWICGYLGRAVRTEEPHGYDQLSLGNDKNATQNLRKGVLLV